MNEDTLKGRRKVHPLESHPASLQGWTLSFRMLGLPYAEPGFATIERAHASAPATAPAAPAASANGTAATSASPSASAASAPSGPSARWRSEVHGVVHRLRPADWVQVMATEGVGAGATGYRVVEVEVSLYDGRTIRALSLEGQPASLHPLSRPVAPSRRYLELLRKGARHHGLDPEYVSYLDSLQPYEASGWAPSVGRAAAIAVALPLALPLVPPVLFLRAARKKAAEAAADDKPGDNTRPGSTAGGGAAAAAVAAATAAKYASDLPSKAAAATAASAPLPSAATEAAVAAAESSSAAAAAGAAANGGVAAAGGSQGPVPKELLRPPLVLPAVASNYLAIVQTAMWAVHDIVAAPLLGSGSGSANGDTGSGVGGKPQL